MARLQAEVDGQRSAQSNVTLGYTLDEWLSLDPQMNDVGGAACE